MKKANDKREVSKEGFLIADAIITKVGPLPYTRSELGMDGDGVVMLDRPRSVLEDALPSMRGLPVTRGHPEEFVHPENFKDHLVGAVISEPKIDGAGNVRASVRLYDADAIKRAEAGENQLSPGFLFVPEFLGEDRGVIKEAAFNHLAMVPTGRAGEAVRLLDALPPSLTPNTEETQMGDDNKQLLEAITTAVKDAMSTPAQKGVDVEGKLVDALNNALKPVMDTIGELKEKQAKDEAAAESKKAEDALNEKIEEAVKAERARMGIINDAKPYIAEDKHAELADMDIKDVLRLAIGDAVPNTDNMDLATLNGVFLGVKAVGAPTQAEDASPSRSVPIQKGVSAEETRTLVDIADLRFKQARGLEG